MIIVKQLKCIQHFENTLVLTILHAKITPVKYKTLQMIGVNFQL